MSEKQTINDLLMEVAKLRKDAEYLAGERDYWKQQAQRNDSVSHGCDTDSRAKLEEDVRQYANPEGNTGTLGACWERKMIEFLDRQAAITERECDTASWKANYRHVMKQRDELQEKVDALEAECQKDSENVADWEDSCDTREILEHDCKWMAYAWSPDVFPDDKLEKKLYREIIEKLDRQAAITREECERERNAAIESWREKNGYNMEIADSMAKRNAELEAELNRTCTLAYDGKWLTCSNCGESLQWFGVRTVYKAGTQERALGVEGVRYCPFCGARIEGGDGE